MNNSHPQVLLEKQTDYDLIPSHVGHGSINVFLRFVEASGLSVDSEVGWAPHVIDLT